MIKEVKADRTLLVDGPASVRLLSGRAEILSAPLNVEETTVIRNGKRMPFYVEQTASLDIEHGKDSMIEEVDGDTVPASWKKTAEEILSLSKPATVMIMGEVDSGKTSLCTFLANKALKAQQTVAIIDADLGQSDIGPPTTVGLAYVNQPVKDLFNTKADDVCFVGFTSPGGAEERVVDCIVNFKNEVFGRKRAFLVINTDGWVEGEEAIQYKVMLSDRVAPKVVVGIEQEQELEPVLGQLGNVSTLTVKSSAAVRKRDRERRKVLRELGYKKHLKNAKVEAFPLGWLRVEGTHSYQTLFLTHGRLKKIEETLGIQPLYCEETEKTIWVVLRQGQGLDLEHWHKTEEVFKKKVKVTLEGDEKGLIVGLHDPENRFLSLGIICAIDYRRKVVKVSTPISSNVAIIRVGNVRLDEACREIGTANLWNYQP